MGTMLTTPSIFPLSPLYLDTVCLKTSSNSTLVAINLSCIAWDKILSVFTVARAEYGLGGVLTMCGTLPVMLLN